MPLRHIDLNRFRSKLWVFLSVLELVWCLFLLFDIPDPYISLSPYAVVFLLAVARGIVAREIIRSSEEPNPTFP
jgi:hypothetical protein